MHMQESGNPFSGQLSNRVSDLILPPAGRCHTPSPTATPTVKSYEHRGSFEQVGRVNSPHCYLSESASLPTYSKLPMTTSQTQEYELCQTLQMEEWEVLEVSMSVAKVYPILAQLFSVDLP